MAKTKAADAPKKTSMSGMFTPRISAARPLRVFVFRPAWPSAQPVNE